MPRDGLITNRYSRYLDTSILRYFDTLIRSMPRLDQVVYDSSPPSRGKLLRSHTTIDTL